MADPKVPTEIAPNEPYPTGNPPDPMEEYYKANPERKLDKERAEQAEKATKAAEKKAPVPAPSPEEIDDNSRRGKK